MKRLSIGGGVYKSEDGGFWARPWILRRRTWRKLKAVKVKEAIRENANAFWSGAGAVKFRQVAEEYLKAHCPNKRLERRPEAFCEPERKRIETLLRFFGSFPCNEITLATVPKYKAWRVKQDLRQGTGERTVDKDLCTLSNVLSYGCMTGQLETNLIRSGRPRYRTSAMVRHSREVAPANADVIHELAGDLLGEPRGAVLGWQMLFGMFTGCRTSELLRLRFDAQSAQDAGFYQPGYLSLGRRSKHGLNPFALVGPEFAECLEVFRKWHSVVHPKSTSWYFPSPADSSQPVSLGALGHAMTRMCKDRGLPHMTPHGQRSFYVTKRRSDGASDLMIAGEIGDKTVALMQSTYGARPENWTGGSALSWLPSKGKPAWQWTISGLRPKLQALKSLRKCL